MSPAPIRDGAVPGALDLIDAVVGTLREDLLPTATGRERYLLQVCAAALDIVGRELALTDDTRAAEQAMLDAVGAADRAQLVAEIRAGVPADRLSVLLPALRARVEADLRVTRPDAVVPR